MNEHRESIPIAARVDITEFAAVAKFIDIKVKRLSTRSDALSTMVSMLHSVLVKGGHIQPFKDPDTAMLTLRQMGILPDAEGQQMEAAISQLSLEELVEVPLEDDADEALVEYIKRQMDKDAGGEI